MNSVFVNLTKEVKLIVLRQSLASQFTVHLDT
jgi:hypothetical protein